MQEAGIQPGLIFNPPERTRVVLPSGNCSLAGWQQLWPRAFFLYLDEQEAKDGSRDRTSE